MMDAKNEKRRLAMITEHLNPRTAGGLSHLRTAGGGADDRPPPRELKY